jgi:photosystem II stability/assembly factor-like uncharacterized protein
LFAGSCALCIGVASQSKPSINEVPSQATSNQPSPDKPLSTPLSSGSETVVTETNPLLFPKIEARWELGDSNNIELQDQAYDTFTQLFATPITFATGDGKVALISMGGTILRTEDAGRSWQSVSNLICKTTIKKDQKSGVLYVGTRNDCAVYKSIDAGKTWKALPNSGLKMTNHDIFGGVFDLSVDSSGRIWIDIPSGIYKSEDGGANWSSMIPSDSVDGSSIVELSPFKWKYVEETQPNGITQLYTYESRDNGQTWESRGKDWLWTTKGQINALPCYVFFIGDPTSAATYISARLHTEGFQNYLLRTTNGGKTWEGVETPSVEYELSRPATFPNSDLENLASAWPSYSINKIVDSQLGRKFFIYWSGHHKGLSGDIVHRAIDPNDGKIIIALAHYGITPLDNKNESSSYSKEINAIINNPNTWKGSPLGGDENSYHWLMLLLSTDSGKTWAELNMPPIKHKEVLDGHWGVVPTPLAIISSGEFINLYFYGGSQIWYTQLSKSILTK